MTPPVFLNGRFISQPVTGVQRFAAEITKAIHRLIAGAEWPETTILTPPLAGPEQDRSGLLFDHRLRLRTLGRTRGHLWEQTELPLATRDGVLVNLGNTAPLLAGRHQVVVIHDAGVFDTPASYSVSFRALYKTLQRGLARVGARIVTVSEFSRGRIAARLKLEPEQIVVIHEGAEHIQRVRPDPHALERHHLRPHRYALVVGNRVAHKNLAALQDAATALKRRDMTLAVAGAFYPGAFREAAGTGFVEQHLGRVTDAELHALYASAACLLFPSRYEGFGLPPVEAMACGCPVIASAGGAVEEICGDDALYFAGHDGRSITHALERLLEEDGLAEGLRMRGLARAAALSWDASARALREVLRLVQ